MKKDQSNNYSINCSELYPEPQDSVDEDIFAEEDDEDSENEDESNDFYGLKDMELR